MAKKTYPAWHYYVAAGIALFFGLVNLAMQSWLSGAVFMAVGLAVAATGFAKRGQQPAIPAPHQQP